MFPGVFAVIEIDWEYLKYSKQSEEFLNNQKHGVLFAQQGTGRRRTLNRVIILGCLSMSFIRING